MLTGTLRAPAVTRLLPELPVVATRCSLDLKQVEVVDSAGLALLLEWQRRLMQSGGQLELINAPAGLIRLAQISGVDTLLGLATREKGEK